MSQWDGIDEFVAVAVAGSFIGGAKALHASATHVSRAVMMLEQRVQAQLFHRTTRSVRLTDTGRVFLDHCTRMVQERDEAIALINERGEPQGELRVACSTAMGELFISPILRRYTMANPRLSVTIEMSNRLVDLVAEGFDLAIRTGALADSRLIATRIASRAYYTCAAPAYLATMPAIERIEDLAFHQCICGTNDAWYFKRDDQPVLHRPRGRFRCNSGHAVVDACLAGMGVCQLPDFYVLPHIRAGTLSVVLEPFRADDEPIWAVYPQRRHLLPKIRNVVEMLRRDLGNAMNAARAVGCAAASPRGIDV